MPCATRVCCKMISETHILYGSVISRHGKSRLLCSYHFINTSEIAFFLFIWFIDILKIQRNYKTNIYYKITDKIAQKSYE